MSSWVATKLDGYGPRLWAQAQFSLLIIWGKTFKFCEPHLPCLSSRANNKTDPTGVRVAQEEEKLSEVRRDLAEEDLQKEVYLGDVLCDVQENGFPESQNLSFLKDTPGTRGIFGY